MLYYLPLYFETVLEYSPMISGVALFPMTFTVAPAAVVVGFAVTHTGAYRWAIWAGFMLSTAGLGLMYLLDVTTTIPQWIFLTLPGGIGLGMLFPSLGFAIQASSTNENMALAVGMFSFFRSFGQAIGVAVGGVIFQNRMYANLLTYPPLADNARLYSKDAAGLVQIIRSMSNDGDQGMMKIMLKQAYADSLKIVWIVCCGLLAAATLLSSLTESYDLTMGLTSEQTIRDKNTKENGQRKDSADTAVAV